MSHRTAAIRPRSAETSPALSPSRPVAPAPARSGGQALDGHTQAEMAARFGHDFSSVRIHTDTQAAQSAGALDASAYALGSDIVFGEGRYQPGSPDTERLLAHELTHVVQQARFGGGDPTRRSQKSDASEREAEGLAAQVLADRSVDVTAAPDAAVARDPLVCSEDQPDPPPDPTAAPSAPAMDAGVLPMDASAPAMGAPAPAPAPTSPASSTPSAWQSAADNPITNSLPYGIATNNTLSGASAVTDAAAATGGIDTLPALSRAALRVGGERGMNAAFSAENALAAPAAASRLLRPTQGLGGMSPVSAALAPLGVVSNAISLQDDYSHGHYADAAADAAGLASSTIATTALAGAGLTSAGATGAGAALTGAFGTGGASALGVVGGGTALGTAGAALGAGAAGYAAGRLLDQGVNWAGQRITGDRQGDYSISNGLSHVMSGADDLATRGMRAAGAYDDHRPEYTQTLGYRMGSLFTPTVRADGTRDSFMDRLRENF